MAALNPTPFTAEEERNLRYIEHIAAELVRDDNIKICVLTGVNADHTTPYSAAILTKQDGVHRILHHRCIGGTRMEALCGLLGVVESEMWNINLQADAYQREKTAGANEKQEVGQKRKLIDGGGQDDNVARDDGEKKKIKLKPKLQVPDTPKRNLRSNSVIKEKNEGDELGKGGRTTKATKGKKSEVVVIDDDEE